MTSGIYKIVNTNNGKVYIGSSRRLAYRMCQHRSDLRAGRHVNTHLQNSWNKHGEASFSFQIIELCAVEQLVRVEQQYLDSQFPEFNFVRTVVWSSSHVYTEAEREAKRQMMLGEWSDPEARLRRCASNRDAWSRNREARTKMLQQSLGKQVLRSDGKIFVSIRQAAKETGCPPSAIDRVLAGKRKSTRGYSFEYVCNN